MTTTATTAPFATDLTNSAQALEAAELVAAALQTGVVEDRNGTSAGFALDVLYRFFLRRAATALQRDREITLVTLKTLGSVRGYRIAVNCAKHSDEVGASFFWEKVADELLHEAEASVLIAA
jgi:hypothetical protein